MFIAITFLLQIRLLVNICTYLASYHCNQLLTLLITYMDTNTAISAAAAGENKAIPPFSMKHSWNIWLIDILLQYLDVTYSLACARVYLYVFVLMYRFS